MLFLMSILKKDLPSAILGAMMREPEMLGIDSLMELFRNVDKASAKSIAWFLVKRVKLVSSVATGLAGLMREHDAKTIATVFNYIKNSGEAKKHDFAKVITIVKGNSTVKSLPRLKRKEKRLTIEALSKAAIERHARPDNLLETQRSIFDAKVKAEVNVQEKKDADFRRRMTTMESIS